MNIEKLKKLDIAKTREDIENVYLKAYFLAEQIIEEALGEEWRNEEFINIRKIARYYNIEIIERDLHDTGFTELPILGYIDVYKNAKANWPNADLYVNQEVGKLSRRVVIANGIVQYVLCKIKGTSGSKLIQESEFVITEENIFDKFVDLTATFLLMPLQMVLKYLYNYICGCKNKGYLPKLVNTLNQLKFDLKVPVDFCTRAYYELRLLYNLLYNYTDKGDNLDLQDSVIMVKEYTSKFDKIRKK